MSFRQRLFALLSIASLAFCGRSASAWNDLGHMTVARIAWLRLSEAERIELISLLRHHPHLRDVLLKDCPANTAQEEWLFVNAATWPDRVRPPRTVAREPVNSHSLYRFHHPTWHYANWEFDAARAATQVGARRPAAPRFADSGEIIEQIDRSFLIVTGADHERSQPEVDLDPTEIRAIRLCWMMHLIGDIHQPLHVINFVNPQIPQLQNGDDGGNKLAIRTNHNSGPKNLHAYWDDQLGTHPQFSKVEQLADYLTHDPQYAVSRLPELVQHKQTQDFAIESYQIAKDAIYQGGRLHFALWSRVESHELASADVPVLSQQVVDQAHQLAQRQILLAGLRLAERLKLVVERDRHLRGQEDLASPAPPNPRRPQFVR